MAETDEGRFERIGDQLFHYSIWYALRYGLNLDNSAQKSLRETVTFAQEQILERYTDRADDIEFEWVAIEQGVERAELALSELVHAIAWIHWGPQFPFYPYRRYRRFLNVDAEMFKRAKKSICPMWPIC
ncbi:MAG: hypothetical protein CVT79_16690 [Alphaproteobacteria bacterium HGW-Alphaproteobacteria-18]|nr:MAG: hypothetical protein CVT79_16690 [Alphaproteobacteria bacterium HGW-Alphaproteobacteria-18]